MNFESSHDTEVKVNEHCTIIGVEITFYDLHIIIIRWTTARPGCSSENCQQNYVDNKAKTETNKLVQNLLY